ncbi:hypothetical protein G5V59_03535 [Nocardioides sp. W3-2-3]|uniref:hypothetical protein n=1 Tax=Nocardioides convexus TaxID=2712224 RepID=UPI0024184156|nr:hypothetical protein [Nocardioides convexus]NGZ99743.1 hypothetical protein [Nocardioides convexus]
MLLRLRRPATLFLTALLPASLALAACGGSDDSELKGLDAVSVSGKVGEAPKPGLEGHHDRREGDLQGADEG